MSKRFAGKVLSNASFKGSGSGSGIKPVFKPHFSNPGETRSFEKNLPQTEKVGRPWEAMNVSKDEFFGRKYGNISDQERQRLNEKVERQRRARSSRVSNEREERDRMRQERQERFERRSSGFSGSRGPSLVRNPLFEYIYGTHSVKSVLSAGRRGSFNKLYVHNCSDKELIRMAQDKYGVKVVEKSNKNDLNILCNNGVHNGIVLETKSLELKTIYDLGVCKDDHYELSVYDDLYDKQETLIKPKVRKTEGFPIGLFLDGITDPQNMGGIVRSAYYFGVDFIVLPENNSARLGPVTNKASVGSLDLMDIYESTDSLKFIDRVRKNGWNVISTSSKPTEHELEDLKNKHEKVEAHLKNRFIELNELSNISRQSPVLLVMGSEGEGVRTNLKLRSDYLVGIDKGRTEDKIVDSLNVSVAAGILIGKCVE